MTQEFRAEPILAGLKPFQRDTVDHVLDRFYSSERSDRFLVADETGLGKSMVARGVIAGAIERLQYDDSVPHIDILYLCSNTDLARQNMRRLDVVGNGSQPFADRLTKLVVRDRRSLADDAQPWLKPINVYGFTPGTAFQTGQSTGQSVERILLLILLEESLSLRGARLTAALKLFKQGVRDWNRFKGDLQWYRRDWAHRWDPQIVAEFHRRISLRTLGAPSLLERVADLIGRYERRDIGRDGSREAAELILLLRNELSRSSIGALDPNIVILDEFQRFRELLDPGTGPGELAHLIFDYEPARVLLLSATPFKPYTLAEEEQAGESHSEDFLETIKFLARGTTSESDSGQGLVTRIATGLAQFREAVVARKPAAEITQGLRADLLRVMCRAERPELASGGQVDEQLRDAGPLRADEIVGYASLKAVADSVGAPVNVDYWKSTPYFANFMDGYKIREKIKERRNTPGTDDTARTELDTRLAATRHVRPGQIARFEPIDVGNARMRAMAAVAIPAGFEQLLWVAPTVPYWVPQGPYANPACAAMTKTLVFSSWAATPTAIGSLLSYQALRLLADRAGVDENTPEARRRHRRRLSYAIADGRPTAMTALAIVWPMPRLARLADPYAAAVAAGGPADALDWVTDIAGRLDLGSALGSRPGGDVGLGMTREQQAWRAALSWEGSRPDLDSEQIITAFRESDDATGDDADGLGSDDDQQIALSAHIREALSATAPQNYSTETTTYLARIAAHSPANCAWRALHRLVGRDTKVTANGLWRAAARIAEGFRSLFNRYETMLLLDGLSTDTDVPYWSRILDYAAAGNLQAVLDEYLYHLCDSEGIKINSDQSLMDLASATVTALVSRPATYQVFNPSNPDEPVPFRARFAARYTSGRVQDDVSQRPAEVRAAFNSPFWPMILASTSVGQEGIDFHWWCHRLVHWNIPANAVDFEQREGRINRYRGHAIRRNIAAAHRADLYTDPDVHPWSHLYALAARASDRRGGLVPDWIYPGPSRIERVLLPYPLSSDHARIERIKKDLARYRLTFGQSRQEDLVEILRGWSDDETATIPRLDLSAPHRSSPSP